MEMNSLFASSKLYRNKRSKISSNESENNNIKINSPLTIQIAKKTLSLVNDKYLYNLSKKNMNSIKKPSKKIIFEEKYYFDKLRNNNEKSPFNIKNINTDKNNKIDNTIENSLTPNQNFRHEKKQLLINLNLFFDTYQKKIIRNKISDEYFAKPKLITIDKHIIKNYRMMNKGNQDKVKKLENMLQITPISSKVNSYIFFNTDLSNLRDKTNKNNNSHEKKGTNKINDLYKSTDIKKNLKMKDHNNFIPNIEQNNIKIISPKYIFSNKYPDKNNSLRYNRTIQIIDPPPPQNYYSDNYFYYNIFPQNCGWLIEKCFGHRKKWKKCHSNNTTLFNFKWKDVDTTKDFIDFGKNRKQIFNHFEFHSCLSNKYNMFYNFAKFCEMNHIDVFKYVPFTIGFDCLNYNEFNIYQSNFKDMFNNIKDYIFENDSINSQLFDRKKIPYRNLFPLYDHKMGCKFYCEIPKSHYSGKNLWIVKAPNLNRGRCIKIFDNYVDISKFLLEMKKGTVNQYDNIKEEGNKDEDIKKNEPPENNKEEKGDYQSDKIIIQKYIEKPFLYNNRKFDIRIWTLINQKLDVFIFKEGHLKACSVNYSIDNNNSFIHLTNYSLQKYNKNFSKYEKGNEISFNTFQQFLDNKGVNFDFRSEIIPKFKKIIELTSKSSKNLINFHNLSYCFEIFGYDFMMDEEKNVYLIEINTNPGLELSSKIIEVLVPRMIDDALRLTVDKLFETEYDEEWKDENGNYKSQYHVDGYDDKDNMWEYICNINKSNDKYICEDYYGFGYIKNSNKRKKKSKKKE